MSTLHVKIPFWYKPFIRFMHNFWESFPEEKYGSWATRVDVLTSYFVIPIRCGKEKGNYSSLQKAYLRARWRALWKDVWTRSSKTGVEWVVVDKNAISVRSYGILPKVSESLSYDQIYEAQKYHQDNESRINDMLNETEFACDVSESEDKDNPMLWKPGHWLWFLHYEKPE